MSSSPVKSTSPVATGEVLKTAESVVEGANCAAGDSQQKCASNDIDDNKKTTDCAAAAADKTPAAKPAAASTAVGTAKAGIAKSGDHPVPEFIPAPPPATNAWTARMQAAAPTATKTESTSKPDTVAPKTSSAAAPAKAPPVKANTSSAQPSVAKPASPPAGKPIAAGTAAPKSATGDAKKDEKPKNVVTDKKPVLRKDAETSDAKKAADPKKSDLKTETKKPVAATANTSPPDPSKPTDTTTTTPTVIPAPIPVTSPWGNVSQTPVTSPWANTPAASTTVQSSVAGSSGGGAWGAVGAKQMKPSTVQRVDKAEQTSELDAVKPAAVSSMKNVESKPVESTTRSECRSVEVSVSAAISHNRSSGDHKTQAATTTTTTTTNTTTTTSASDATTTASAAAGHVTRSEESRRWEKNSSSSTRPSKAKDDQPAKSANLNDSADWPSLNKQPHKEGEALSPVSAESLSPTAETADQPTAAVAVAMETMEPTSTAALSNHIKPSSDSDDTKDAGLTGQVNKKKTKGSKQKWSPLEIEIPKPRRRRGTGRPRNDSREYPDSGGRDSREGAESSHEVREGREGGRGGGRRPPRGGRESHESGGGGARRSRGDRPPRRQSESEVDNAANTDQSDRLRETTASSSRAPTGPTSSRGWNNTSSPSAPNRSPLINNTSPGPVGAPVPGRMGYQGSRRAMNRGGRGGYGTQPRGAGNRYPQQTMWTAAGPPAYSYISFGGPDLTQFCYQVEQSPPTYFTPIVSQSDYYTSVLADEAAKKLIAQQIEYYFSVENLTKDFFLRRQMDPDGWIAVDLLASFRRVRIHTGAVNVQLILDSMAGSKVVEISADQRHMRTRFEPLKWSLQGVEPTSFSRLNAEVAEFVPGKPFKLPSPSLTTPSASFADNAMPDAEDKISPAETNILPTEDKTDTNVSSPTEDSESALTSTSNLHSDPDERSPSKQPADTSHDATQESPTTDSPTGPHPPPPPPAATAAATIEQTSGDDAVISAVTAELPATASAADNTGTAAAAAAAAESSLPQDEESARDADV